MPSTKKIIFFKQIAIFLSIIWTVMTYSFFIYQMSNEKTHILRNTITKAKSTTQQAEELITWAFDRKIKSRKTNHTFDINTGFSLRDLIYSMAKKQGSVIVIESNYLDDDFDNIDKNIEKTIKKAQKTKTDTYTIYKKKDNEFLFYIKPLLAKKSCLECHVHDDEQVGDLLGNINMSIKILTLKEYNPSNYYFLIFTYLTSWIVGLIIIWWIRYKSRQYFDEKTKHYEESIYSFVDMIERRDSYTAGHSKRVAKYASLIAQKLGLDEYDVNLIHRAGMLHDIGKIEVPDALLLKPDKLTNSEFEIIKTHSKVGYELLSREPFYELALIVLYHHENYDGSGYPYGLKGDDIPFLSQIISVADVYDALTTNRAYRKALSKEEAIKIIEKESGKKFNPKIVKVAKEIFASLEIEDNSPLLPKSLIKEIRFSYFFRDQLTGFFNINYLKFILSHTQDYTIRCAYHINFVEFTKFNTKHGWKKGDEVLQKFSEDIVNKHKDCTLVRLFADNFLIINLERHFELNCGVINTFEKEYKIKIEYKHIDISKEGVDTFDKLEDLILTS